jgi:hypothetical protein
MRHDLATACADFSGYYVIFFFCFLFLSPYPLAHTHIPPQRPTSVFDCAQLAPLPEDAELETSAATAMESVTKNEIPAPMAACTAVSSASIASRTSVSESEPASTPSPTSASACEPGSTDGGSMARVTTKASSDSLTTKRHRAPPSVPCSAPDTLPATPSSVPLTSEAQIDAPVGQASGVSLNLAVSTKLSVTDLSAGTQVRTSIVTPIAESVGEEANKESTDIEDQAPAEGAAGHKRESMAPVMGCATQNQGPADTLAAQKR